MILTVILTVILMAMVMLVTGMLMLMLIRCLGQARSPRGANNPSTARVQAVEAGGCQVAAGENQEENEKGTGGGEDNSRHGGVR